MSAITVGLCVWILSQMFFGQCQSGCYDENGHPKHCMPEYVNAAFELPVEATNTCGEKGDTEFCSIETRQCKTCDAKTEGLSHGTEFLTDFNRRTSWQSETMLEGIQNNVVNLTLNLRKDYEVTSVSLQFQSPRPESFVIYKKTTDNDEWIPWQYFSGSCQTMYNIPPARFISKADEDQAICTGDYSDISPFKGGTVHFSTLVGRPSAFRFEQSPVLQNWVTASSIRISLTRLNTFGDEAFGEDIVLKTYYYAVSDISVGSRCKCNGHASSCSSKDDETVMCNCEHHTTGQNCDRCEDNYVDKPWARATTSTAFECLACNCNNMTDTCYFDEELYTSTGHGGHCIDCSDNTDGPNCERCKVNHFRRSPDNYCTQCSCNPTGSESLQCDDNGKCKCNPGVIGDKCDRCQDNHHDFGQYGCQMNSNGPET